MNARARVFKNYLDDVTKNKGSTHIVRAPDGDFFLSFLHFNRHYTQSVKDLLS